jgi:HSP90 family molecular chaperone
MIARTLSYVSEPLARVQVARSAPFVEKLVARGYEVLFLTDAIDEAMVTNLAKFGDRELVDVSKEGIKLDAGSEEEKAREAALEKEFAPVAEFLKQALGERVEKVVVSNRWVGGLVGATVRASAASQTCFVQW